MKTLNFNDDPALRDEEYENDYNRALNEAKKSRRSGQQRPEIPSEMDLESTQCAFAFFKVGCEGKTVGWGVNASPESVEEFQLSYEDWFQVWLDSGYWFSRVDHAKERYNYIMARVDPSLTWTRNNVEILSEGAFRAKMIEREGNMEDGILVADVLLEQARFELQAYLDS